MCNAYSDTYNAGARANQSKVARPKPLRLNQSKVAGPESLKFQRREQPQPL
jgi:hypothetical protein